MAEKLVSKSEMSTISRVEKKPSIAKTAGRNLLVVGVLGESVGFVELIYRISTDQDPAVSLTVVGVSGVAAIVGAAACTLGECIELKK